MATTERKKIKIKQRIKRHKRRLKLSAKGVDPKDYFFGKYYVGPHKQEE